MYRIISVTATARNTENTIRLSSLTMPILGTTIYIYQRKKYPHCGTGVHVELNEFGVVLVCM